MSNISNTTSGASSSPLVGAAQPLLPSKLWVWVEGGGANLLKKEAMDDVAKVFQEFKEIIAQKIVRDGAYTQFTVDQFEIDLNLRTKQLLITNKGDQTEFTIDLRSMDGLASASSENTKLLDTAIKIEQLLRDHKLIRESNTLVLGRDYDESSSYSLAPKEGIDGFTKVINRFAKDDFIKEVMQKPQESIKDALIQGFFKDNDRAKNKANLNIEKKFREIKYITENFSKLLEKSKEDLDKNSVDPSVKKDEKLLEEKIQEIKRVNDLQGLLYLICTLREFVKPNGNTKESMDKRADDLYNFVVSLFENEEKIGTSKVDKKTAVSSHVITDKHKKLAALISAATIFSNTDFNSLKKDEYNRMYQYGYQRFLEKHQIDPNTDLGMLGSLLRWQTLSIHQNYKRVEDIEASSFIHTNGLSDVLKNNLINDSKRIVMHTKSDEFLRDLENGSTDSTEQTP